MKNIFHTYTFHEAKNIVICGDIHGEFNSLIYKLCIQYQLTDTLLIVAGDCGFGFEKPGYYEQVFNRNSSRLSKSNNWIVMMRGNHDDPTYFSEEKIKHQRFRTIPDYSVIQACGHNILCIGGAISKEGEYLLGPVREYVDRESYTHYCARTQLKIAALGNDAGIIGAAMLGKSRSV